jgi:F0F1-type ATP synthase delta subunit
MHAKEYAQALYDLTKDAKSADSSLLVKNLSGLLKSRGHERLLPQIIAHFERIQAQKSQSDGLRVYVADEKSRKDALHKAKALADERGIDGAAISICEDQALIRGYAIEGPGFRFDTSARASLLSLYKHLTKAD